MRWYTHAKESHMNISIEKVEVPKIKIE